MSLPKIKFRKMTLSENIEIIKWAYFDNNGFLSIHDFTVKLFPELATINSNMSHDKVYEKIESVVTIYYNKYNDKIISETLRYNLLWQEYNDKYFEKLSSFLNVEWPKNIKEITASVGIIPVFPRYLDSFSFSVGIDIDAQRLVAVCAHETLHFLWFEKWKKLYPTTPRKEFDSPFLVWQYSEMVTDPILNNNPFLGMFDFNERGYNSFYELVDNGTKVMDNLRNIYRKDITIEEKIDKGYEYINCFFNSKKK